MKSSEGELLNDWMLNKGLGPPELGALLKISPKAVRDQLGRDELAISFRNKMTKAGLDFEPYLKENKDPNADSYFHEGAAFKKWVKQAGKTAEDVAYDLDATAAAIYASYLKRALPEDIRNKMIATSHAFIEYSDKIRAEMALSISMVKEPQPVGFAAIIAAKDEVIREKDRRLAEKDFTISLLTDRLNDNVKILDQLQVLKLQIEGFGKSSRDIDVEVKKATVGLDAKVRDMVEFVKNSIPVKK